MKRKYVKIKSKNGNNKSGDNGLYTSMTMLERHIKKRETLLVGKLEKITKARRKRDTELQTRTAKLSELKTYRNSIFSTIQETEKNLLMLQEQLARLDENLADTDCEISLHESRLDEARDYWRSVMRELLDGKTRRARQELAKYQEKLVLRTKKIQAIYNDGLTATDIMYGGGLTSELGKKE